MKVAQREYEGNNERMPARFLEAWGEGRGEGHEMNKLEIELRLVQRSSGWTVTKRGNPRGGQPKQPLRPRQGGAEPAPGCGLGDRTYPGTLASQRPSTWAWEKYSCLPPGNLSLPDIHQWQPRSTGSQHPVGRNRDGRFGSTSMGGTPPSRGRVNPANQEPFLCFPTLSWWISVDLLLRVQDSRPLTAEKAGDDSACLVTSGLHKTIPQSERSPHLPPAATTGEVLFFLMYLFIYFCPCWVFIAVHGCSLIMVSRGYSLVVVYRLPIAVASLVVEHGL